MANEKRGMRRNLTAYGDEEFSLFLRRAFIKAIVADSYRALETIPMERA